VQQHGRAVGARRQQGGGGSGEAGQALRVRQAAQGRRQESRGRVGADAALREHAGGQRVEAVLDLDAASQPGSGLGAQRPAELRSDADLLHA
jgi:hypothetical protein